MKTKGPFQKINTKLFLLGFILSLLLLLFLYWIVLNFLMQKEANQVSKQFLKNLGSIVQTIDEQTKTTLNKEYYDKLHQQRINFIADADLQRAEDYVGILREKLQSPFLRVALFTDCDEKYKVHCYYDNETKATDKTTNYNPKSRPWYFNTRAHQDWVLSSQIISGDTRRQGYPAVWGLVLTQHKTYDPNFQLEKGPDGYYSSYNDKLETGVWISLLLSYTKNYSNLKFAVQKEATNEDFIRLMTKGISHLQNVDLFFQSLRFPSDLTFADFEQKTSCQSIIQAKGLWYDAKSICQFYNHTMQFSFQKEYDQYFTLVLLALLFCLCCLIVYFLFRKFFQMQQKAFNQKLLLEKDQAAREMGARLVHDLKKGVLARLNLFRFDYENDFELESEQEDFLPRLKTNLNSHFQVLKLLNRYIDHLVLSFQRRREKIWKLFSKDSIQQIATWLDVHLTWEHNTSQTEFLKLSYDAKNNQMQASAHANLPNFWIPEFAMFRVFKNIIDNFHAYGTGTLELTWTENQDQICLEAKNTIGLQKQNSTQLGLKIIQQILEDNFGQSVNLKQTTLSGVYDLKLCFPKKGSHDFENL